MGISVERQSKVPLYEQIEAQLNDAIEDGTYGAGDPLPSVRDMAKELGVNPQTVVRVYRSLESRGVIVTVQGKGTFVSEARIVSKQPMSSTLKVFISYAHSDNEHSHGGVDRFKQLVQDEYALQTGEDLDFFYDTDSLKPGMNWRREIDEKQGISGIFMPILTPTYLRRPSCISEFKNACHMLMGKNFQQAILPIRFVEYKRVLDALPDDEIANIIDETQDVNWASVRNEPDDSPEKAKVINELVSRIIEIDEGIAEQKSDKLNAPDNETVETPDDEEGALERSLAFEGDANEAKRKIEDIARRIETLGETARNNRVTTDGASLSPKEAKVEILKFSREISRQAEDLRADCRDYSRIVSKLDRDLDGYMELVYMQQTMGQEVDIASLNNTYEACKTLNSSADENSAPLEEFNETFIPLEKISSTLRKPFRSIRGSLDEFQSSKSFYEKWEQELQQLLEDVSKEN